MALSSVQDSSVSKSQICPEDFAFLSCQIGAEPSIKQHFTAADQPFRLAFSRPGLLTFKLASGGPTTTMELLEHPLVRQAGRVIGQVRGQWADRMVQESLDIAGRQYDAVHVYARDSALPGALGFEPGVTPLCSEIAGLVAARWGQTIPVNSICGPGARILDLIVVEPDHWMVAQHQSDRAASGWPGGVFPLTAPEGMISRAYLKVAEAIAWSGLPIASGDAVVEIGSSPGGAAQRLLDMGLQVTGIDPAEMHPLLLEHPRFAHWRAKAAAVRRRKFNQFRWLFADANVAPNYTLDCVQDIVTYPTSNLEGLILTLKLSDYQLLNHLEDYRQRIRSWGYDRVVARQLAHNRRELCLVAQRSRPDLPPEADIGSAPGA